MAENLSPAKIRFPASRTQLISRLLFLIFFLIVLGPMLALIAASAGELLSGNAGWLSLVLPAGRRFSLLVNSIGLAAATATGGMLIALLGMLLLWRWETGWRSYLRWLVLILVPVPAYIHALVWTSLAGSLNLPTQGWAAAWWIETMAYAPIAAGLTLAALKSVDPAFIDSARVMRSDFAGLIKIILPLAAPIVFAGWGIIFILSLLDYGVPSLVNVNVYSLEIFAEYSSSSEPVRAFFLSIPLLAITTAILLAVLARLKNAASSPAWSSSAWKTGPFFPNWLTWLRWAGAGLLAIQALVPLVMLAAAAGSPESIISNILAAKNEIFFTVGVDLLVSLLCIPLALAAAGQLVNSTRWSKFMLVIAAAPVAIPPALTGIGLITIWNRPMPLDVYGSVLMPVMASMARFTPLAAIILAGQLRSIDPALIDAARILEKNKWQTLRFVWLPLLFPGLLAAAGVVFALTLGELGATLLVVPPGHSTLTIRIYNLLHYGASKTVAGLCLAMLAAAVLAGAAAVPALTRWANISAGKNNNA